MADYLKLGISSKDVRWTLEDYVMELFDKNKTHTDEFKSMIRIYGKEKIADIYAKYVALRSVK